MRVRHLLNRLGVGRGQGERDDVEGGPFANAEFLIPNMICEGCCEKIDLALKSLDGVRDVRPNVVHKRIRVQYEPAKVDAARLKKAVVQAGFTAVEA